MIYFISELRVTAISDDSKIFKQIKNHLFENKSIVCRLDDKKKLMLKFLLETEVDSFFLDKPEVISLNKLTITWKEEKYVLGREKVEREIFQLIKLYEFLSRDESIYTVLTKVNLSEFVNNLFVSNQSSNNSNQELISLLLKFDFVRIDSTGNYYTDSDCRFLF